MCEFRINEINMYFKDHGNGTYTVTDFKATDLPVIARTIKTVEEFRATGAQAAAKIAEGSR